MSPRHRPALFARGTRVRPVFWLLLAATLATAGCISYYGGIRPPAGGRHRAVAMELTGYCNCGACCNWHRTWFGLGSPVISTGPGAGRHKDVGRTSSGAEARRGTIAADVSRYPYGTIVEIPGYVLGRVEDTGGAIKGDHMDLWFPDHDAALRWGRQRKLVKVWLP